MLGIEVAQSTVGEGRRFQLLTDLVPFDRLIFNGIGVMQCSFDTFYRLTSSMAAAYMKNESS